MMEIRSMERVVFFGAGKQANNLLAYISKPQFRENQYIAFSDNNSTLWGKSIHNLKIISPSKLNQTIADCFVITSPYYEQTIKKQLMYEIGIPDEKIYSFDEYDRKCYTRWQYKKKYGKLEGSDNNSSKFDLNKLVIYTAITGDYDKLRTPLFENDNLTYVCFTNNPKIKSDIWNIEYIQDEQLDNRYLAKKIKMNPDLYFKEFETSIWIDGKFEVLGDFRTYIEKYGKDKPILCFPHFQRECIYDEAAVCLCVKKGKKEDIVRQIAGYYEEGYPMNNGLYEMGCIVRRHNDELVKKLMREWEKEVTYYSYRDQLSFPYICWKNDFVPDICNLDINKNLWMLQRSIHD